jgi:hypothetical protein
VLLPADFPEAVDPLVLAANMIRWAFPGTTYVSPEFGRGWSSDGPSPTE